MTGRASAYWADTDPAYLETCRRLGYDTSELQPEIRAGWQRVREAERAWAAFDYGECDGILRDLRRDNPRVWEHAVRSCRIPVTQVQVWDRELAARAALTRVPRMLGVQAGRAGRKAPADPFTAEHFGSQPVPRWRRLLLRLRGWDA